MLHFWSGYYLGGVALEIVVKIVVALEIVVGIVVALEIIIRIVAELVAILVTGSSSGRLFVKIKYFEFFYSLKGSS